MSIHSTGTGTWYAGKQRIFAWVLRNRQKALDESVFFRKIDMNFADSIMFFSYAFCGNYCNFGFFEFFNTTLPELVKVIRSRQSGTDLFRLHRDTAIRRVGGNFIRPFFGFTANRNIA